MNRPSLALLPALAVLACVLALPAAAAGPTDAVEGPDPTYAPNLPAVGAEGPVQVADAIEHALDQVTRMFARPGPGGPQAESASPTVKVQCEPTAAGWQQCSGMICWTESGHGDQPVSAGRPEEGIYGLGADLDLKKDPEGWYGPYWGVYVSKGADCGCTFGVGIKWVVG